MFSALQSLNIRGSAGDPLPDVWQALKEQGIHLRRGQFHLLAAGPGVGKSALILSYVVKARTAALYMSADSDSFTQLVRVIAIETGTHQDSAAEIVRSGDLGAVADAVASVPVRFVYESNPGLEDIKLYLEAYRALYGEYPEMVIVDNLTNLRTGTAENSEDPFKGLELACDELHALARHYQTAVVALHHVTGQHNISTKPVSLAGVKGQITRVPEMVLTLHKAETGFSDYDYLRVSVVKNRGGKADPSGETYAELEFDGGRMDISDVKNHYSFGV